MMSSTGVTTVDTVLLRAIRMPVGRPSTKQTTTERMVTSSRSMLSDQRPKMPKNSIEAVTRIVERMPATAQVIQAAMATTPSQPISGTGRGVAAMLISFCRTSKIALKTSPIVPSTPPKNQLSGAVQLHPVADLVEPGVEPGGVLEAELAGLGAAQDQPEAHPDDDDGEQLQPGAAVLAVLDLRLLLLRGSRLGGGGGRHLRALPRPRRRGGCPRRRPRRPSCRRRPRDTVRRCRAPCGRRP